MTTQNKAPKPLPPSPDQYNKSNNPPTKRGVLTLDHDSLKHDNKGKPQTGISKNKGN